MSPGPKGATADSSCVHIFKERDMCRKKLTQVAGYSAVKTKMTSLGHTAGLNKLFKRYVNLTTKLTIEISLNFPSPPHG